MNVKKLIESEETVGGILQKVTPTYTTNMRHVVTIYPSTYSVVHLDRPSTVELKARTLLGYPCFNVGGRKFISVLSGVNAGHRICLDEIPDRLRYSLEVRFSLNQEG